MLTYKHYTPEAFEKEYKGSEGFKMDTHLTLAQMRAANPALASENGMVATILPPVSHSINLIDVRDGWTECLIAAEVNDKIRATPGFPSPVIRPSTIKYRIGKAGKKGLGMYATENLEFGDLIFSETVVSWDDESGSARYIAGRSS